MASNRLNFEDRPAFMGRRSWGATATGGSHTFAIVENPGGGYTASAKPVQSKIWDIKATDHLDNSLLHPYPTFAAAKAACEKRNDEIRSKLN